MHHCHGAYESWPLVCVGRPDDKLHQIVCTQQCISRMHGNDILQIVHRGTCSTRGAAQPSFVRVMY